MGGIICVVALLGFIAGAIVSGGQAFAGIPSSLQDDIMAYKDDVAYIALDRVDHITIHMKDGSGAETGSGASLTTEVQVAESGAEAQGSAPPRVRESVSVNYNDTDYKSARSSSGSNSSSESSSGGGKTLASDMEGIPAPPSSLLSNGGGTQVAAAATTTTAAQPKITINNTLPEIKVQSTPVVVQSQPSNVNTVSNYYYDYINKSINLTDSYWNSGTQVSVDFGAMMQDYLNALVNDPEGAQQFASLLQSANISITATTNNNMNNDGIILQDSDNNSIVNLEDIAIDIDAIIEGSFNEDSFNTTMENVGNTTLDNVGNTIDLDLTNITNTNSGNNYNIDLDNVGNESFQETINATLNDIDIEIEQSFNGNNALNVNDQDGVDIDDNDGIDIDADINIDG
jgi:hypothetical protein